MCSVPVSSFGFGDGRKIWNTETLYKFSKFVNQKFVKADCNYFEKTQQVFLKAPIFFKEKLTHFCVKFS